MLYPAGGTRISARTRRGKDDILRELTHGDPESLVVLETENKGKNFFI